MLFGIQRDTVLCPKTTRSGCSETLRQCSFAFFPICQMRRFLSLLSASNQQPTRQETNGVFLPADLLPFHLRVGHGAALNRLSMVLYITIGQMYKMCIFYFLMAYEYLTAGFTCGKKQQKSFFFFRLLMETWAEHLVSPKILWITLSLISWALWQRGREKGAAIPDSAECVKEWEPEFLCKCAWWRSCVHGWFTGWILSPCSMLRLLLHCWLQPLSVHHTAWYRQDLRVTVHILCSP